MKQSICTPKFTTVKFLIWGLRYIGYTLFHTLQTTLECESRYCCRRATSCKTSSVHKLHNTHQEPSPRDLAIVFLSRRNVFTAKEKCWPHARVRTASIHNNRSKGARLPRYQDDRSPAVEQKRPHFNIAYYLDHNFIYT